MVPLGGLQEAWDPRDTGIQAYWLLGWPGCCSFGWDAGIWWLSPSNREKQEGRSKDERRRLRVQDEGFIGETGPLGKVRFSMANNLGKSSQDCGPLETTHSTKMR